MSRLAPGRKHDMARLLERADQLPKYTPAWNQVQQQIADLVEEGKCPVISHLREQLLNAARAADNDHQIKLSYLIDEHMKYKHRRRYTRAWRTKG